MKQGPVCSIRVVYIVGMLVCRKQCGELMLKLKRGGDGGQHCNELAFVSMVIHGHPEVLIGLCCDEFLFIGLRCDEFLGFFGDFCEQMANKHVDKGIAVHRFARCRTSHAVSMRAAASHFASLQAMDKKAKQLAKDKKALGGRLKATG